MTQPHRRFAVVSLAAMVSVVGLASCTSGEWRYDVPPAAGVVQDEGPVKARNVLVLANDDGQGLLTGSLFANQPVELEGAAVAGQQQDGTYADVVSVPLTGEIGVREPLELGGEDAIVEGADLQAGLLAAVVLQFSDGTSMTMETVVVSSDDPAHAALWDAAQS